MFKKLKYFIIIIFKLFLTWDIATLIAILIDYFSQKRISDVFVIKNGSRKICQSISAKFYLSTWLNNYYKNQFKLGKILCTIDFNIITNNFEGKVIQCHTHESFEKLIKRKVNTEDFIEDCEYEIEPQVVEKLSLINPIILLFNLFNKEFWEFIFREEKLKTYSFLIRNN